MRIRPIVKSYYNTTEVETLAKNILAELPNLTPAQPVIDALSTVLQETYQHISDVRGKSNFNSHTKALEEADQDRDDAFRALCNLIDAGCYRLKAKHRATSQKIKNYVDHFDRGLVKFGYSRQSSELRLFFNELNKISAELSEIGATAWYEELKAAEDTFLELQKQRLDEEDSRKIVVVAKEVREKALDQISAIIQTLNGLEMANIEGVAPITVTLDNIIAQVESPAKARLTRREKASEEVES